MYCYFFGRQFYNFDDIDFLYNPVILASQRASNMTQKYFTKNSLKFS